MIFINNYKVCVYAICKNEEKFVKRWVNSMKEADKIIVLDTGSTDKTVSKLKEFGVEVHEKKYNPWRFDDARNDSLKLIPKEYEICVCTDLDEVFESNWKEKLLSVWKDDVTRVRYTYNWSFDEYGNPATTFMLNKIHKNGAYKWTHPVHEVLTPLNNEKEILCSDIVLNHYQDKNKSRSSYLPLLELSVTEDPLDDRNMHYLGREYMFYGKYDDAIETLKKHLEMPNAIWKEERCASLRFISRCYKMKKDYDNAIYYGIKAINECPNVREPYLELAYVYYILENYNICSLLLETSLKIEKNNKVYINEPACFDGTIEDLLSVCYYYLKDYKLAFDYANKALELDPTNERIINNRELIKLKCN